MQDLRQLIDTSRKVVLTCHVNPDGDAIGSLCAALMLVRRLGAEAVALVPNAFPDNLKRIPSSGELIVANTNRSKVAALVAEADLIICLDYNGLGRAGVLSELIAQSEAPKVMIDHHLLPEDFCQVAISQPSMCSTCEVLLRLEMEMGWAEQMTKEEAECLYIGMMTDTGAFTYASSRPEIYESVLWLLRRGIDKDELYQAIFQTCTEGKLRLTGYLLYVKMEVMKDCSAALITLTNEEYRRFAVKNGDTEGLVNLPLQIDGIRLSVFLRQDTEVWGKIRVSTRSVGDFPCNKMAEEFFNGGGHKNAAGGSLMASMDEAVQLARKAIRKYAILYKDK
ncbi:MAG: DHH family phosphoesterase [Prevotellaceae bacterium]|nr:DHH family phosphoesterase [Prevotellaceae bacterium]